MIGSLCEAYHWTLDEAFKLTTPQIILLCHVSSEQAKKYKLQSPKSNYDYSGSKGDRLVDNKEMDPTVYGGKKLSELRDGDWETNGFLRYLAPLTNVNAL